MEELNKIKIFNKYDESGLKKEYLESLKDKSFEDYVRTIENEHATKMETKSLGDIVREDISVLNNTPYMKAVEKILTHARSIERED